jgi:hypothetical protein
MSRSRGAGVFAALLRDVDALREHVVRLSKEELLLLGEVASVVQRAQGAVATARGCLDELRQVEVAKLAKGRKKPKRGREKAQQEEEGNGRVSQRVKKKSKKVVEMEEEEEEEEEQEKKKKKKKKKSPVNLKAVMKKAKPAAVAQKKAPRLLDGMVGKVQSDDGETLVYFSLALGEKEGLFECPSTTRAEDEDEEEGAVLLTETTSVKRSAIVGLHFVDLSHKEQQWYQGQLESDLLRRLDINFPMLFANQGCDMMCIRLDLLNNPLQTEDLIERLAQNATAVRAVSSASPNLRAANNAALMVASTLHENLKERGEPGWHETYRERVKDMCERCDLAQCDLKPSTIEQYRKVGALMLRCNVVACLLPSFVKVVEEAVEALLDDEEASTRLNTTFEAKLRTFVGALGESSVMRQQLAGKGHVLELGAGVSPMELEVQSMLQKAAFDGGSMALSAMVDDANGSSGRKASTRRK